MHVVRVKIPYARPIPNEDAGSVRQAQVRRLVPLEEEAGRSGRSRKKRGDVLALV